MRDNTYRVIAVHTVLLMKNFTLLIALLLPFSANAWEGYDRESGTYIEIEKGNLVRAGRDIDFYDNDSGEYRSGEVQSIRRYGSTVEVEIEDSETGETRTFDMED